MELKDIFKKAAKICTIGVVGAVASCVIVHALLPYLPSIGVATSKAFAVLADGWVGDLLNGVNDFVANTVGIGEAEMIAYNDGHGHGANLVETALADNTAHMGHPHSNVPFNEVASPPVLDSASHVGHSHTPASEFSPEQANLIEQSKNELRNIL